MNSEVTSEHCKSVEMNPNKEPIQMNDSSANRTSQVSVAPPSGSNRDQTVRVQIVDTYLRRVLNASHSARPCELDSAISVWFFFHYEAAHLAMEYCK